MRTSWADKMGVEWNTRTDKMGAELEHYGQIKWLLKISKKLTHTIVHIRRWKAKFTYANMNSEVCCDISEMKYIVTSGNSGVHYDIREVGGGKNTGN